MKKQITYNSLIYNNQIKQMIKLLTFLIHVYMIVHDIPVLRSSGNFIRHLRKETASRFY